MEQVGFVLATEAEKAKVEVRRISGCGGGCKTCSGCDTPGMVIEIDNNIGAKIGDMVEIRAESSTILKYTFLTYMIPLVMLVIGLALGISRFKGLGYENFELYGLLVGLGFLFLSFLILKLLDKKSKNKAENMLKMVRVLN